MQNNTRICHTQPSVCHTIEQMLKNLIYVDNDIMIEQKVMFGKCIKQKKVYSQTAPCGPYFPIKWFFKGVYYNRQDYIDRLVQFNLYLQLLHKNSQKSSLIVCLFQSIRNAMKIKCSAIVLKYFECIFKVKRPLEFFSLAYTSPALIGVCQTWDTMFNNDTNETNFLLPLQVNTKICWQQISFNT